MKITTLVPCPQCGAMLARNLVERIEDFGDYGFKCTDQENLIWVGHWEYDDVDNAIFEEQAREIEPA